MAKIKGMSNVKNTIRSLRKQVDSAAQKGILKVAKLIESDAKAHVPVDQGILQASIGVEQKEATTYIFAGARYAAYQEFGTGPLISLPLGYEEYAKEFFVNGKGHTPAKPFLFPAMFKYKDQLQPIVEEEINKVLDKIK